MSVAHSFTEGERDHARIVIRLDRMEERYDIVSRFGHQWGTPLEVKELAHANLQEQSLSPSADETALVIRPRSTRTAFGFDVVGTGLTLHALSCQRVPDSPPPPPSPPPRSKGSKHSVSPGMTLVGSSAASVKQEKQSRPWILVGFLAAVAVGIYLQKDVLHTLLVALFPRIRSVLGLPPSRGEQLFTAEDARNDEDGPVVVELKDYGRSTASNRTAKDGAAYNEVSNAEEPAPETPKKSPRSAEKKKTKNTTKHWLVAVDVDFYASGKSELRVPMAAAIKDATSLKMAIVRAGLKQFGDAATPPMWSLDFPAMDLFIVDEESAEKIALTEKTPFFLVRKARHLSASPSCAPIPTRSSLMGA